VDVVSTTSVPRSRSSARPVVEPGSGMSRGLVFLFAAAGGTAVGNLYWAQPLLADIAGDLGVADHTAAWLVTATQLGYALGIFLLVPLGDVRNRRRLIPLLMAVSAVGLAGCAVAPGLHTLTAALVVVGLTTVSGQLLAPLAGDLAAPDRRGRTVATVVSGVLTGVLAARIVGGLIAQLVGWRAVFVVAAVATLALAAVMWRVLPELPARPPIGYGRLLGSVVRLVRQERTLQVSMVFGATGFAIFSMFWTALTLLLSAAPYSYSPGVIGLFGIAGLVGAMAAQNAGRLHDRGWSVPAFGLAWTGVAVSWAVAGAGATVLPLLLLAIVLLDAAVQTQMVLNQTRVLALAPDARSRLNTAFVSMNFIGGAIGSWAAGELWGVGGWTAVAIAGTAVSALAVVLWAVLRRGTTLIPATAAPVG